MGRGLAALREKSRPRRPSRLPRAAPSREIGYRHVRRMRNETGGFVQRVSATSDKAREVAIQADVALAAAIAKGEPAAMRHALEMFLPPVYAVSRHLLRNPSDAEEVAQETFLRVWKHAGRWTPQGARLSSWVTRIAVNLCYDCLRKSGRAQGLSLDDAPDIADTAPGADAVLMGQDRSAAMNDALAALPARQSLAIRLVHLEEMTNIDAAAAMEVSVEALESLLARGRRGLRALLAPRRDELLGDIR